MEETELAQTVESATLANDKRAEALWLPCQLTVKLPIPGFTVSDLLRLTARSVVDTRWGETADLPIQVNGQLIGWAEFEVVGNRLAVRLTGLVETRNGPTEEKTKWSETPVSTSGSR